MLNFYSNDRALPLIYTLQVASLKTSSRSLGPTFLILGLGPLLISPLNLLLKLFILYSLWIIIHSSIHFIIYLLISLKPLWLLWPFGASRWHMRVLQLRKAITLKPWGIMCCSTYHQKWYGMYYPHRIILPANISKLIPLYIKQTWVLFPNLCATRLSPRVDINLQYHSPMVDINDNQQSIPTIHQPKPTVWQLLTLPMRVPVF